MRIVIAAVFLVAGGALAQDPVLPALPAISEAFGTTPSQTQLVISLTIAGVAIGQLFAGPISDVLGRRRAFLLGFGGLLLASLLAMLAPSFGVLLIARFAQGFTAAFGIVLSRVVISDSFAGREAVGVLSLVQGLFGIFPVALPVYGALLLGLGGWRFAFLGSVTIVIVALLLVSLTLPETLHVSKRTPPGIRATLRSYRDAAGNRRFWAIGSVVVLSHGCVLLYGSTSSLVVKNVFGLTPLGFSFVFTTSAMGLVVLGTLYARVGRRFDPARVLWVVQGLLLCVNLAFLGLVLANALTLPAFIVWATTLMGCQGIVLAAGISLAVSGIERGIGAAVALLGLLQYGFSAVVVPLGGAMGVETFLPLAALSSTLVILGILIRYFGSRGRKSLV